MDNDDDWLEEEEGTCSSCGTEVDAMELDSENRCKDCAIEAAQDLQEQIRDSHD